MSEQPLLPDYVLAVILSLGMAVRGFDSTAGQAMSCIANAAMLVWLLHRAALDMDFWRRASPVLALIFTAMGWGLLASLQFDGSLPDYVPGKLLSLLSGLAALLCGAIIGHRSHRLKGILDWLLLINCLILLGGLVVRQIGTDGMLSYWTIEREDRFTGLIGNANVTAAMAGCFAIIAFARLTDLRGAPVWAGDWRPGHIINLPMFVISFGVVMLTAARLTAVLLGIILTLFALHWLLRRTIFVYTRLTAIIAGITIATLILAFAGILFERFGVLGTAYQNRVMNWSHLAGVVSESPTYGYGLGAFSTINAHSLSTPRYAQANWTLNSAHNIILQLMLQGGWPYLVAICGAAALIVKQTISALRNHWSRDEAIIAAILCLIMGNAMIDVVLDMPAPVTIFLFLSGLLWGRALQGPKVDVALSRRHPMHDIGTIGG
ncbi:O-antigen ligase family protein [Sphingobium sp.]|uniref:O-antigen ligase family protein n=1 Tax=Sphingobium sp. TaxID=1912891 RepID=UPI003BB6AFE3